MMASVPAKLAMTEEAWKIANEPAGKTLAFLRFLLRDFHPRDFTIELWDETRLPAEHAQFSRFTWKICDPAVLKSIFSSSNRQVALAEQYILGEFDIVGDMEAIFPLADHLIEKDWSASELLQVARRLVTLRAAGQNKKGPFAVALRGPRHEKARDRAAIRYHYDVSNDFYALWLDKNMLYSSAYFAHPGEDIDSAQINKLHYICRKLRLKTGERLLDIGCGWGGLMIHAARHYGVRALGITLSQAQLQLARQRIQEAGLSNRCEVRLLDYRDLPEGDTYDKLVSIGMVEHVGESNLATYFAKAYRLLRRGGVFLSSGIARAANRPDSRKSTFTDLYVFPDGELETIGTMVSSAEQAGFEVRDVESLREHYYLTAIQWLKRLEARAREAQQIVGDRTYRIWRLYLAGSAHYFQKAWLNVYQILLVKAEKGQSGLPLRRTDWQL